MKPMIDFSGKRIAVFGASSGIGRCTAVTLHGLGARLLLIARRADALQETAALCGGDARCVSCDLTDSEAIGRLIKDEVQAAGAFGGMVYSAGMNEDIPVSALSPQKAAETFQINYFAFLECVRQITKRGRYTEGLRIVGISSVSSLLGEKAHCAYAGSKAAMDASVRVMAKELAPKGICINTVAPGMIMTEMTQNLIRLHGAENSAYERTMQRQYLGMGEPQDAANAVCFLLSDAARLITGVTLPVDGGFTTSC